MTGFRSPLGTQALLFVAAGLAQLVLDTAVFIALTAAGLPLAPGNVAGRVCGAALGFWLNGRYTFAGPAQPRLQGRHLARFIPAWLLLTLLSTLVLSAVEQRVGLQGSWLAKPAVEAGMAGLGFFVWRYWVFR